MEKELKIHIFCLTPDICCMISKYFSHTNYKFKTTQLNSPEYYMLEDLGYLPDFIIVDSEINNKLKHKIYNTYSESKIIHLPSLTEFDNEINEDKDIIKISEPLKLRELEEIFKNITF
jgi:hypothetical protein